MHKCVMMLLKEIDLALQKELCAILPKGYYATAENSIKRFNPVVQPLNPMEQTENQKTETENMQSTSDISNAPKHQTNTRK